MTTVRKSYGDVRVRAAEGGAGPAGRIKAMVSVFGNVDLQGDRVMPGAFAEDIRRWQLGGFPLPMIFSHNWQDLDSHIGGWDMLLARETAEGLELTGTVDLEDEASRKVHRLMAQGRLREFSFAFDIEEERPGPDLANELVRLRIIEAGPTLKGANPDTRLVDIKAALAMNYRHSSSNNQLWKDCLLEKGLDAGLVAAVFGNPDGDAAQAAALARERSLTLFKMANDALVLRDVPPVTSRP